MKNLNKMVQQEFVAQDKENAKLAMLKGKYGNFQLYHEFGKCWLGKIGDGGFVLTDKAGGELKRWDVGINSWAEACDIINKSETKNTGVSVRL